MNATKNYSTGIVGKGGIKSLIMFSTAISLMVLLAVSADFYLLHAAPSENPEPPYAIPNASIRVGDLERTYLYYVPKSLKANLSLVFVFHGGTIDGEQMRAITAYELERLADENNFIVVYPNGVEKSWNGCRKRAPYPANLKNIDDPAFVRALMRHFRAQFSVDSSRIFAMGFSNGAHLVYRLALEMPNEITAIAAVGANLPVEEDCDCFYSNRSVAVMIVNGNRDRINKFMVQPILTSTAWRRFGNSSRGRGESGA